ncbi:phosphotransferase enzyme family protein [Kitasatospora sp. NPDC001683]
MASVTGEPAVADWKRLVAAGLEAIHRELPAELRVSALHPVQTASWNAVLRAEADERSYCVKVMNEATTPVEWTLEELDVTGRVLADLRARGFSRLLPALPLGEDGRYALRCAGYAVVVFPWCDDFDHPVPPHSRAVFASSGAAVLHELHSKGRAALATARGIRSGVLRRHGPDQWAENAAWLWEQSAKALREHIGAPPEAAGMLRRAREQAAELAVHSPEFFLPTLAREDTTVVHGDFRPENVLVIGDTVHVVHDFDFLRVGRAEEDVAYAALYYSGRPWFHGRRDWQQFARFLTSYQQAARQAGRPGLRRSPLEASLYWTVVRELSMSFQTPTGVAGQFELLEDLRANVSDVLDACL